MRIKLLVYAAVGLMSILTCGCSSDKNNHDIRNGRNVVVVTIPPLEYFVKGIGGDKVDIECIAPASADPETFEPSMAQLRKASQAEFLLTVGLLPFEDKVVQTISDSNPSIKIVELADSIDLIEGTHDHGHKDGLDCHHGDNGAYDPHIWTSLRNARIMARNTCRALTERFPDDSLYFKTRLDSLDHRLDSIDRRLSSQLESVKGKAILVWHPSLSYFARDYGLRQLAVGQEHKEFSITGLQARLDHVIEERPLAFFYQREYDNRQSLTITRETGLEPVIITPLSPDIEEAVCKAAYTLVPSAK